jgi:hypothetical protein
MITINYLPHSRPIEYWKLTSYFLNNIKPENKKKIRVNILATINNNWLEYLNSDIESQVIIFPPSGENYLSKVRVASGDKNPYSIKLDEDCFMSSHVWDYFIENIHILDDPDTLIFSPLVSTNIPLVDNFIESYVVDNEVKNKLYELFLTRSMPNNLWGVDYSSLNQYTVFAEKWDCEGFYEGVGRINHYYRGIHPIRISIEAQMLLNDYVLNTVDRFISKQNYSIKQFDRPYFTNNIFAFRTEEWKNILQLPNDGFDEVPLSEYKNYNNKKCFYIENGFCLHPMYNTVFGFNPQFNIGMNNGIQKEFEVVNAFSEKVYENYKK